MMFNYIIAGLYGAGVGGWLRRRYFHDLHAPDVTPGRAQAR